MATLRLLSNFRNRYPLLWVWLYLSSVFLVFGMLIVGLALVIGEIVPEGDQIAYTNFTDSKYDIYVLDIDRGIAINLLGDFIPPNTFNNVDSWSPDGRYLLFTSDVQGGRKIFIYDTGTRTVEPLLNSPDAPSTYWNPAWSPDGHYIAFAAYYGVVGDSSLFLLDTLDNTLRRLEPTDILNLAWSPDSQKLAIVRILPTGVALGLFTLDIADSESLELTAFGLQPGEEISWSPDGKRILYVSARNGNYDIYAAEVAGGEISNLTNHPSYDTRPMWSPDGQQIVFDSDRDGDGDIYLLSVHGGGIQPLTSSAYHEYQPVWSPDGEHILYSAAPTPLTELYIMNKDGSSVHRLPFNKVTDTPPLWRPR